jgi:hypothetical protein
VHVVPVVDAQVIAVAPPFFIRVTVKAEPAGGAVPKVRTKFCTQPAVDTVVSQVPGLVAVASTVQLPAESELNLTTGPAGKLALVVVVPA